MRRLRFGSAVCLVATLTALACDEATLPSNDTEDSGVRRAQTDESTPDTDNDIPGASPQVDDEVDGTRPSTSGDDRSSGSPANSETDDQLPANDTRDIDGGVRNPASVGSADSDSSTSDSSTDGSPAGGPSSGTTLDASPDSESTTDASSTDGGTVSSSPIVSWSLRQRRSETYAAANDPVVSVESSASVSFYNVLDGPSTFDDPCERVDVGSCTVTTCPGPEFGDLTATNLAQYEAVEYAPTSVSVTGLSVDPLPLQYHSTSDTIIPTFVGAFESSEPVSYWSGTETARLLVEASDEVPSVDYTTPPLPSVSIIAPGPDALGQVNVDPSAPITVAWDSSGSGGGFVAVSGIEAGMARYAACEVDLEDGSIVIDPALVEGLEGTGTITVSALLFDFADQDGWRVGLFARHTVERTINLVSQ